MSGRGGERSRVAGLKVAARLRAASVAATLVRRPLVTVAAVLVLATCAAVVVRAASDAPGASPSAAQEGIGWTTVDPVPWPSGQLDGVVPLNGAVLDVPLPDGPVLVNFWASTCPPCRREMPVLEEVAREGAIGVVGISRDVQQTVSQETIRVRRVTYPNLVDTQDRLAEAVGTRVPLVALPSSLLVVDGVIRAIHLGAFDTAAEVHSGVESLLADHA